MMRRFIAGAVCPDCRAMDRTVVEIVDGHRQRRCVDCGHREQQVDVKTPEPANRFAARDTPMTTAQPVRLLEPIAKPRLDIRAPDSD